MPGPSPIVPSGGGARGDMTSAGCRDDGALTRQGFADNAYGSPEKLDRRANMRFSFWTFIRKISEAISSFVRNDRQGQRLTM